MIGFFLQPSYRKKTFTRMLQDEAIHWDLNIIISQGQRKIEGDGHPVENGEEHRKRSPQGEVDESEAENEFPIARYPSHSTPIRIDEKQFSGEIPRWRVVAIFRSNLWLAT